MKPLRAFALLLTALFINRAYDCGIIGRFVARGCTALMGAYGTGLVVVALGVTGLVYALPKPAWRVVGRFALRVLFAYGRLVRWWLVGSRKPRAERRIEHTGAKIIPLRPSVLEESAKVKDTRGTLKSLGYTGVEIAAVMPRLDESDTIENMIRAAIKLLQGKKEKVA